MNVTIRSRRNVTVLDAKRDLYETTAGVLRIGVNRHCWACGHDFGLGDNVSIIITTRGNKALCGTCFDEVMP